MKTLAFINGKSISLTIKKVIEKNPNNTYYVAVNVTSEDYPLIFGSDYINETMDPEMDIQSLGLVDKAIQSFRQDIDRSVTYYEKELNKMKGLIDTKFKGGFL